MTNEHETTIEDRGPDPRDEQIAELQTRVTMLQAQVDAARPGLVRDAIARAGFDPESQDGRVLQELSKTPDFRVTPEHVAARADELGFEPSEQTRITPEGRSFDPRYPADAPRNTPGDPANERLARQQRLYEKNRELEAAMEAFRPTVAEA